MKTILIDSIIISGKDDAEIKVKTDKLKEIGYERLGVGHSDGYFTLHSLARKFSEKVLEWIGQDKMLEVISKNATPQYSNCCATHEYCDPNQAMLDILEEVGIDPFENRDNEISADDGWIISPVVDDIWEAARKKYFYLEPVELSTIGEKNKFIRYTNGLVYTVDQINKGTSSPDLIDVSDEKGGYECFSPEMKVFKV